MLIAEAVYPASVLLQLAVPFFLPAFAVDWAMSKQSRDGRSPAK
jgi:hypothetical protein